jgi:hypothetical protein
VQATDAHRVKNTICEINQKGACHNIQVTGNDKRAHILLENRHKKSDNGNKKEQKSKDAQVIEIQAPIFVDRSKKRERRHGIY